MAGRRDFLSSLAAVAAAGAPGLRPGLVGALTPGASDRQYWLDVLTRLAQPVLTNLAEGRLRQRMPVEIAPAGNPERRDYTHLEAVGRLFTGIAPWLELGGDASPARLSELRPRPAAARRRGVSRARDRARAARAVATARW